MEGYILIDCGGLELTSQEKLTISGIYNDVRTAYNTRKLCIVYNCLWEGFIMSPISVMINERPSGHYIATASTLQIEVDQNDGVTIINMLGQ